MSQQRNRVGTYIPVGAFRAKDGRRRTKAAQRTQLPPRCTDCRLPGTVVVDGVPYCPGHAPIEGETDR